MMDKIRLSPWLLPLHLLLVALVGLGSASKAAQNGRPLMMTKLRHDFTFLQASRYLQQELDYEELKLGRRLALNGSTEELTYYVNDLRNADDISFDHLVVGALHETYTSRLFRSYMFTYDNPDDRPKASDKRLISKQRCLRELDYLVRNLNARQGLSPELVAFYDSYGRAESGLLNGNHHWLGKANQCQQRLVIDPVDKSGPIAFRGRHCVASIRSRKWSKLIKEQQTRMVAAGNYFKYERQAQDYERFFRIQVAICLPQSCDSRSLDWAHKEIQQLTRHQLIEPYNSYDLVDLFCLPDEASELRQLEPMAWLFIILVATWLTLILVATCCDDLSAEISATRNVWQKFVFAMSFKKNWSRFLALPGQQPLTDHDEQPRASDLAYLNFFKTIFMPAIILGHLGTLGFELKKYQSFLHEDFNHSFVGGVSVVNWFFVLTGFITSYIMCLSKMGERSKVGEWLYAIFHRYWRLAPIYLMVFWFSKHLLIYMGQGPIWDYGTSNMTHRALCRSESWWFPLTMSSNFRPIHDECIMGSWYISNDMQFFLLAPLLMLGLYRWPKRSWLVIVLGLAFTILHNFHDLWTNPRASHLDLMRPRKDILKFNIWLLNHLYTHPWHRIGPYLLGILAGHYAFMVRSGQWWSCLYKHPKFVGKKQSSQDRLRSFLLNAMFLAGLILMVAVFFSLWFVNKIPMTTSTFQVKLLACLVYSLLHNCSGMGMVLALLPLIFGHWKKLHSFMAHPLWAFTSKLNYIVLMVHVEVMWVVFLGSTTMANLSHFDFVNIFISFCFYSYLIAAILTPLLEIPLSQLELEFIGGALKRQPRNQAKELDKNKEKSN